MATHTLEEMLSHSAAARLQEQNVGNNDVVRAAAVMPATTIPPGRRCEARMEYRGMCSYEVFEAIDEESVVIEQEEACALNQSKEGMLLLMGEAPQAKQLIEVHTPVPDGAGPRMSLKSDGPGPFRWSHLEICIWLDASGYSAPVTICRSSPHYSRRLLLQPPPRRCDKPGRELDAARRAGSPLARSTYCFK